jgi:hypothetical protein
MKDKLYNAIREMILDEMDEAKQGRISNNFVIANADKANRLKELFDNSDTHKWVADMIEIIMEAGETGVDRKNLINTLNDETRSLIKSGVLSLGGLSRPKKEKAPLAGKRGRPAKSAEPGMMSDLRAAMQSGETGGEEEEELEEIQLNESFSRMKKLAGII